MNNHLITLLSGPDRDALLREIDASVGALPDPSDIMRIRRVLPDTLLPVAGVIIDIVLGTRKARRLGKAHPAWWFTVQGAEQATHPTIAEHHARRFDGRGHVVEVCTGVGMDTLALARRVGRVTTYESDTVTAALAVGNLCASGVSNVVIRNEALDTSTAVPDFDGLWADPSRRRGDGRRTTSTREYSPLLETLTNIADTQPSAVVGIKCGPGDTIAPTLQASFASEFIGFNGECRERILWRNADVPQLSVSLPDHSLWWAPTDQTAVIADEISEGEILVEPHPALIASGAVGAFFREHRLHPIHEKIAYAIGPRGTTDLDALSNWAHAFEIVRTDRGVSEKRIQENLRDLGWGNRTEFKKRGWNGEPEELRRTITFAESDEYGVVIIARTEYGHVTLYCRRLRGQASSPQ